MFEVPPRTVRPTETSAVSVVALRTILIALVVAFLGVPNAAIASERQSILFRQATILDGTGDKIRGDVLVRDGRIVEIGPDLPTDDTDIIDATGLWLTPGLIDVHTHYGTFLLPYSATNSAGSDITEQMAPHVGNTWIEHGVRPADPTFSYALAAGVTTAQVLPGSTGLVSGRAVTVRTSRGVTIEDIRLKSAPRGIKLACGANPAAMSGEDEAFPNSRQGQIAFLREALVQALAFERGGGRPTAEPSDQNELSKRQGNAASLLAAIHGEAPVHLHCYRAEDIFNWVVLLKEFGVPKITVHHASEAYKIAPFLVKNDICVALWPDWWGFKREAEDAIFAAAAMIDDLGGCVTMHSDIPALGSLLNIEAAKAAAAGKRAGFDIPTERAITWITGNAAKVLGIEGDTGTIRPGNVADLVLWSGNPLSIYSKPMQVYVAGQIAYDDTARNVASDFELGLNKVRSHR